MKQTVQSEHPQKSGKLSADTLVHAAWLFTYAALWPEQDIMPVEVLWAKLEIDDYFQSQEDPQKAFVEFCERVTIANRYAAAKKLKVVTEPFLWFCKDFAGGFTATRRLHERLQANQDEVPQLWAGMCTLAQHYWEYTQKPSKGTFYRCRKQLQLLQEYGLLQLFYNVIIYSQFLKASKRYGTVNR